MTRLAALIAYLWLFDESNYDQRNWNDDWNDDWDDE